MNFRRLAALNLAAVNEDDRNWILDRLSQIERLQLEPLLQEAMTYPREYLPELIHKLERKPQSAEQPSLHPVPMGDSDDLKKISRATLKELKPIFHELPLACIALLLDKIDWLWTEEYLSELDPEQRSELASTLSKAKQFVSDEFLARLVARVVERLQPALIYPEPSATRFESMMSRLSSGANFHHSPQTLDLR